MSFRSSNMPGDGIGYSRKEARCAEHVEQPVGAQTILHRPLHLSEIHRNAAFLEFVVQRHEPIRGADVDVGDWLGGDYDARDRACRLRDRGVQMLAEYLDVRIEKRASQRNSKSPGVCTASG